MGATWWQPTYQGCCSLLKRGHPPREGMRGHLVQFRCHTHDAIELAHVYHASNKANHLGYKALCIAQGEMAHASHIVIYTAGEIDIHARQLVCDVHSTNSQASPSRLERGSCRQGYPTQCPMLLQTTWQPLLRQRSQPQGSSTFRPTWLSHQNCDHTGCSPASLPRARLCTLP